MFSPLILKMTVWSMCCYFNFVSEETEIQRQQETVCTFIHSFIHKMITECLLCAKYCTLYGRYSSKQNKSSYRLELSLTRAAWLHKTSAIKNMPMLQRKWTGQQQVHTGVTTLRYGREVPRDMVWIMRSEKWEGTSSAKNEEKRDPGKKNNNNNSLNEVPKVRKISWK